MRGPVISHQQAQDLNTRVQSKLAPWLFACCNYEPTSLRTLSEDGWFAIAVQDLYKFAIDASPVFENFYYYLPYSRRNQFSGFFSTLNLIKMLRAVTDHNQSPDDGYSAQECRITFRNWVSGVIGKAEPETLGDFALLNQRLEHLARTMLADLNAMVDCFSTAPNKSEIVSKWLERILYWYSHNTKTQYYFNQIADAYIARSYSAGHYSVSNLQERQLKRKVNRWIETALCKPLEDQIQDCKDTIETKTNLLNGGASAFSSLMRSLSAESLAIMRQNWQTEIAQAQTELTQQEKALEDLQKAIGTDAGKYLYGCLSQRLTALMAELDAAGDRYTLLPQDLLQRDVQKLFAGVHSPENDF